MQQDTSICFKKTSLKKSFLLSYCFSFADDWYFLCFYFAFNDKYIAAFFIVRRPNFGVGFYSCAKPILKFAQNLVVGLYSKVGLYSRQYGK